jgi:hypothetical protein
MTGTTRALLARWRSNAIGISCKGRAKGLDQQRYPNALFIRAGLTFLTTVTHPDPPAPRRT